MKVLVCGGRYYSAAGQVFAALDGLEPTEIIEGGASGADRLAAIYAKRKGIPLRSFPADWDRYGRFAGPRRNAQMLAEGKPDIVLAFPGGKGTANMIEQAGYAGVGVMRWPH